MDTDVALKAYPVSVPWEALRVEETPAEYVFHRPRLYLETTIPSFLTARPMRDLNTARLQRITTRWWNSWHTQFEIFVSSFVIKEARVGDPEAAQRRLEFLKPFRQLPEDSHCKALRARLRDARVLPPDAHDDLEHIAIASVHRMEYLLSWNCAHLANPYIASKVTVVCASAGYSCPILCTPLQLLERYENGHKT